MSTPYLLLVGASFAVFALLAWFLIAARRRAGMFGFLLALLIEITAAGAAAYFGVKYIPSDSALGQQFGLALIGLILAIVLGGGLILGLGVGGGRRRR